MTWLLLCDALVQRLPVQEGAGPYIGCPVWGRVLPVGGPSSGWSQCTFRFPVCKMTNFQPRSFPFCLSVLPVQCVNSLILMCCHNVNRAVFKRVACCKNASPASLFQLIIPKNTLLIVHTVEQNILSDQVSFIYYHRVKFERGCISWEISYVTVCLFIK